MTMSAGEVDYNSIFQLTSEGAASEDEVLSPIPYPVSFLIWIFFLILMPILLMNLLVSCRPLWLPSLLCAYIFFICMYNTCTST